MDMKDDEARRNGLAGLSLSAILGEPDKPDKPTSPSNRTLMDIIREDPNSGFRKDKKNWSAFKDMIRLHRAGVAWTSIITIPVSDVNVPNLIRSVSTGGQSFRRPPTLNISDPIQGSTFRISVGENQSEPNSDPIPSNRGPQMVRRDSTRVPAPASKRYSSSLNRSGDESPAEDEEDEEEQEGREESAPAAESISLMSLLDFNEDDDEDDEEYEDEGEDECVEFNTCSVCMVSHKGEAFVPCGHAFCRLCSRELWVQRGSCPLCNGFVVEILDIF